MPAALFIFGCATQTRIEGTKIDKTQLINLKPGASTRQMVLETFGTPTEISFDNNTSEEKMLYVFKEKKIPFYFGVVENEIRSRQSITTLELIIRNNVVYSYKFKSAEN